MTRSSASRAASVNSACLLAAIAFIYLPGCSPQGVQPGDKWQHSESIAEAKKRGTFLSEVEIIPNRWNLAGKEITFEAAWLERMPDGYFLGPFALSFRIDQGKEVIREGLSLGLVLGEKREGFLQTSNPRYVQYTEFLDSDDLTHLRASLVKDYDEERQKNIRFVRKDNQPDKKIRGRK
jgi:hypothetical protein